jgi:hypothetical protein
MTIDEVKRAIRQGKWDYLDIPRTNMLLRVKFIEKQIQKAKGGTTEKLWKWDTVMNI